MRKTDVAIIGAGIVGSAIAWELSKYPLDVTVLEKENDIALGATRANSGIIHAGYDPEPGSLSARLNVVGANMAAWLCRDLDVPYRRIGSLVLAFSEADLAHLDALHERGRANGVRGLKRLSAAETLALEPAVAAHVRGSLLAPEAGIVNPWEYAIALMEVAIANGVSLRVNAEVTAIDAETDGYRLTTSDGAKIEAALVINAAGVYADEIGALVAPRLYSITPTKGEYFLFDKSAGRTVSHVLFRVPDALGKGVLIAPTVHGNLIVGPDAEAIEDKDDTSTVAARMAFVQTRASEVVPSLSFGANIRNFAGLRAVAGTADFIIEFARPRFLNVAGIKSPGLTAAPAIALEVAGRLADAGLMPEAKRAWHGTRRVRRLNELRPDELNAVIAEDPAYGHVVCRCETVSEGEIRAACRRGMTPVSLDGIKRRTGAGMGRCQGGFCGAKIVGILAAETGIDPLDVCQDKAGSRILTRATKTRAGHQHGRG